MNFNKNPYTYFQILIIIISSLNVIFGETLIFPDTQGYLNADIYRSFGYPFFIKIHQFIFGKNVIFFIKISQSIIFLNCVFYFIKIINNYLKLNDLNKIIFAFFLIIPVFYEGKILNSILTESVSYSLYLLTITFFIEGFIQNSIKYKLYSYLTIIVLLQIRSQFLFMIPVFLLVTIASNLKFILKKQQIIQYILIVSLPIIAIGIDYSYHTIYHNKNTTTPFTGIQIASLPFFVSQPNDYKAFENKNEQAYFKFIHSKLEERKLLYDLVPEEPYNTTDFFFAHYTQIANRTLSGDGDAYFTKVNDTIDKTITNDVMSKKMVLPLIKKNFFNYCKIYFQNYTKGIGSSKILLVYLIILAYCVLSYYKDRSKIMFVFILSILLLLANIGLVTFAEHVISRYTFYNNWVLPLIILYLLQNNLKTKND